MANPIRSVNGQPIKVPSSYVYDLQDISAADAGRTEDTVMDKMRIGQAVKLELSWKAVSTAEGSAILNAFNPEYVTVEYLDLMSGGYRTSVFYVGDRTSPAYSTLLDIWENVSFNLIERSGLR
jgi:hypothetical protein